MKKSLSIFLCVLMVAFTLCSCKITKDGGDDKSTTERGKKDIVYVTDENGDYVTEKDGKKKTEVADASAEKSDAEENSEEETMVVYVTDKNKEVVTDKAGQKVTEVVKVSDLKSQLDEKTKKSENSSESKTQSSVVVSQNENVSPDKTLMKTVVEPVLKSGNYTVKGKIKAEGQTMTATIAFRNAKDYYFDVTMMGISVIMFSNAGKYYMAIPTMKSYAEIPSADAADLGIGDITDSFKEKDAKYVKTTTVKEGKNTYTCEEYKTSSGTAKYYFDADKNWKRMEISDSTGADIVWDISSFSKTADDKLFTLDKSWKKNSELADMF